MAGKSIEDVWRGGSGGGWNSGDNDPNGFAKFVIIVLALAAVGLIVSML